LLLIVLLAAFFGSKPKKLEKQISIERNEMDKVQKKAPMREDFPDLVVAGVAVSTGLLVLYVGTLVAAVKCFRWL
jgi:hypothetical protein